MKKIAEIIVNKKIYFLVVIGIIMGISIYLMPKVNVNYDIADYLPEDSDTTQGIKILQNEFTFNGTLQIVIENITKEDARKVHQDLKNKDLVRHVESVSYDEASEKNYKVVDGVSYALFVVTTDDSEYSDNATMTYDDVTKLLDSYKTYKSGGVASSRNLSNAMGKEITIIMLISVAIVAIVLLIACSSFLEPLIFGITIAVSIIINMGTNYFLGEVSYITQSITAILQLALSMDYAIIIFNKYHQLEKNGDDAKETMKETIKSSFIPIVSSSFTTVASLLALAFMTLKIGFDMGIVLAKGIVSSMICVMVIVPSLMLFFNKLLKKWTHKQINFRGSGLSKIIAKYKYIIAAVTLVLVITGYALQTQNEYSFLTTATDEENVKTREIFGNNQQMLIIYDNGVITQEEEREFVNKLYENPRTTNVLALSTIKDMEISYYYAFSTLNLDLSTSRMIFSMYNLTNEDKSNYKLTIKDVFDTVFALKNSEYASSLDGEILSIINGYEKLLTIVQNEYTKEELLKTLDDEDIKKVIVLTSLEMEKIYSSYYAANNIQDSPKVKLADIISFVKNNQNLQNELGEIGNTIRGISSIYSQYSTNNALYTYNNVATLIKMATGETVPIDLIMAVYAYNMATTDAYIRNVALGSLLLYIDDALKNNDLFKQYASSFPSSITEVVTEGLKSQFIGKEAHTRIIIEAELASDQEEIFKYVKEVRALAKDNISEDTYLAGGVVSFYDIKDTFSTDLLRITLITIIAIFLIIMIGFKSLLIPVILVLTIQGAIWISLAFSYLRGEPVFFMSYIVVSAIQMGATIDYGIIITSSYMEKRKTMNKKDAMQGAIKTALPSVFTSGLILIVAGYIIGFVATQVYIYSIGLLLGRGTIISCILVLVFLPTVLYILDKPIERLTFKTNFFEDN